MIVVFLALALVLAVSVAVYGYASKLRPPDSQDVPPTVSPTLLAKMAAWAQRSIVFSCGSGERIAYLGVVTPIADQRAGYTLWRDISAGTTLDDLLKAGYSEAVMTALRNIGDLRPYRAMILTIQVNYTISDWNTIDWIHQKQLAGYAEALCWSFHNQALLKQSWYLDADQQETVLDGLAFISAIRGNTADETLALYRTVNVELNPTTLKSAHWLQTPWTQKDDVSCEMLDFINWLSRRSTAGIAFSAGEPARSLIQPGGLPLQTMKCVWITRS